VILRYAALFVSGLALLLAGCDDGFGPGEWTAGADTLVIFSAQRAENLGLPGALDVSGIRPVRIESPGETGAGGSLNWDFALVEAGGQFAFAPVGLFGADDRAAAVPVPATSFEELRRAPDPGDFPEPALTPLQIGMVYAVRTRRVNCGLSMGVRYGKLQVLSMDAELGSVRVMVQRNPFCNDRAVEPPGT
jgi:hypothetical protein